MLARVFGAVLRDVRWALAGGVQGSMEQLPPADLHLGVGGLDGEDLGFPILDSDNELRARRASCGCYVGSLQFNR